MLQGAEESDDVVLHIGTTNFPWVIDMAMLRSGRFSKKIFVSSPDYEARLRLFELETMDANLAGDVPVDITLDYKVAHQKAKYMFKHMLPNEF